MTSRGRRWPNRLAAREGLVNARVGNLVSACLIAITAWVAAAVGLMNTVDVAHLVTEEQRWIDAGGLTFIVEPARVDDASQLLDARRCDRLGSIDGVTGAFAVAPTRLVAQPSSAPDSGGTLFVVSPGALGFFGMNVSRGTDVMAPDDTLARAGLAGDETTSIALVPAAGEGKAELTATTRTIDDSVLADDLKDTYLLPGDVSEATTCYIRSDAPHADAVLAYLPAALASESSPAVVRTSVPAQTFATDFRTAYQDRSSKWAWAAGAAVLALFWVTLQRSRRGRLAVYATFGAGPRARLVLQVVEWAALSLAGCFSGWLLSLTLAAGTGVPITLAVTQSSGQVALLWLASTLLVLVSALLPAGTLLEQLKDRT